MRIMVMGGTGFIGRHAAAALLARGHSVAIGTRQPRRARRRLPTALHGCELRETHLETLTCPADWTGSLDGIEVVVNSVGILRERGRESYDRVHHRAPAALAAACSARALRLVHVSALGLHAEARSRFLLSKLAGERAIAATTADYSIVRPSLLDGEGGFGAAWIRRVARWPVHFHPADARGRIAALDVRDLGEAIAVLSEARGRSDWHEVELGGTATRTMVQYLDAMRVEYEHSRAMSVPVPALLTRIVSHLCDLAHFSPFSYGHLELLRRDNLPRENVLPALLGRTPLPVGRDRRTQSRPAHPPQESCPLPEGYLIPADQGSASLLTPTPYPPAAIPLPPRESDPGRGGKNHQLRSLSPVCAKAHH